MDDKLVGAPFRWTADSDAAKVTVLNTANSLTFCVGDPIVTIHPGGRIELHDGATPDDGAKAFWDAVKNLAPSLFNSQ